MKGGIIQLASPKGLTELTPQMEIFLQEILKGNSQRVSYLKAYPKRSHWKMSSVDCEATKLFNRPLVKQRYHELLDEFREKEKTKTGWTREQAIEALRFVIDTNRKDLERIQAAAEEELELLQQQIIENPERAAYYVEQMIKRRKKARANATNNNAIIQASAELNKMQGYNEENINMASTIIFSDEENLEE